MSGALTSAYPLHVRPYRETSLLVDLLTRDEGRVSVVARGARSLRNKRRALIQPFSPLLVAYQGKSSLQTLTAVENNGMPILLSGKAMLCGLYMNELLLALLAFHDGVSDIFDLYDSCLRALSQPGCDIEVSLRRFELTLLAYLGYGIAFSHDSGNGRQIEVHKRYHFHPTEGFMEALTQSLDEARLFSGEDLVLIAQDSYESASSKHAARRVTRIALQRLLGEKRLRTKDLFKPINLVEKRKEET